ncbi:hypothetical protein IT409_01820 [Candidatus Falkowbacteria bacterium]|nr:hypothetical protein [Candidatus Falkowbacteria bacterium]
MSKSREELLARKHEILAFLAKHYQKDPSKLENFTTKYPDFSESDIATDPSSEANEVAEYETSLEIEHALEQELAEIEAALEA